MFDCLFPKLCRKLTVVLRKLAPTSACQTANAFAYLVSQIHCFFRFCQRLPCSPKANQGGRGAPSGLP